MTALFVGSEHSASLVIHLKHEVPCRAGPIRSGGTVTTPPHLLHHPSVDQLLMDRRKFIRLRLGDCLGLY